jgi:hypothetical protein
MPDRMGAVDFRLQETAKRFKRFDFLIPRGMSRCSLAHKSKRLESPKRFTSNIPIVQLLGLPPRRVSGTLFFNVRLQNFDRSSCKWSYKHIGCVDCAAAFSRRMRDEE